MNRDDFNLRLKDVLNKIDGTLNAKSADYAGDNDVYSNFMLCERFGVTSCERGILVRMLDKVGRIANLFERERICVRDESVADSILDLAGYAILLYIWLTKSKEVYDTTTAYIDYNIPCRS